MSYQPGVTGQSRVFLLENGAGPANKPNFESCMKAGAESQSFGDITKIECPSPNAYGQYEEVGEIRGAEDRLSQSLMGRYALDLKSKLYELGKKRCSADIQVHFGTSQDPSDFNDFAKAVIYENSGFIDYSTDDLGALGSDENAVINETTNISVKNKYEFLPMSYAQRGGSTITNELVDVVICDSPSCGTSTDSSDGCQKFFAASLAAGGSPGTPPDVVFSIDKGSTILAHDIDTMASTDNPTGIACLGQYLVVISADTNSYHYALLSEFDGATDPEFTEVSIGFVTGGEPNDIFALSNYAFIVGNSGYIYGTDDTTSGVTVLEAGSLTTSNYTKIHALSNQFAVAVGEDGVIAKTENGTVWTSVTGPVGIGTDLTAVWLKDEKTWFVAATSNLYYTKNGGVTWTEKTFPGSGVGTIYDVQFPTNSVGFMSHTNTSGKGRILESVDGGYSWIVAPRDVGVLPANDRLTAIAACKDDHNFVVGVGLADDGSDGFMILGEG